MRKSNEILKQGWSKKSHFVLVHFIPFKAQKKSNRAWWHLVPWSKWTMLYVCLDNIEREQTVIPTDKRVCLASKLHYLALAKIPFRLNNVRGECEKDVCVREEHSWSETVNISTVLWEKWYWADREVLWTSSYDAIRRKYDDGSDHLLR